jgi:hypothetical protein
LNKSLLFAPQSDQAVLFLLNNGPQFSADNWPEPVAQEHVHVNDNFGD